MARREQRRIALKNGLLELKIVQVDRHLVRSYRPAFETSALTGDLDRDAAWLRTNFAALLIDHPTPSSSDKPAVVHDGSALPPVWRRRLLKELAGRRPPLAGAEQLLLSGPPGTGKTTCKALCNSLQMPLVATSVSTWLEGGHFDTVLRRISLTFKETGDLAPAIVFIDEVDGIGKRVQSERDYADYWNAVVNKLLELLDGAVKTEGIVVIGATNRPQEIDAAITRSGRLEKHIVIPKPGVDALVGRAPSARPVYAVSVTRPPSAFCLRIANIVCVIWRRSSHDFVKRRLQKNRAAVDNSPFIAITILWRGGLRGNSHAIACGAEARENPVPRHPRTRTGRPSSGLLPRSVPITAQGLSCRTGRLRPTWHRTERCCGRRLSVRYRCNRVALA